METPLPNDSLKASLSPPVGGRLHSFRRDWQTNKCSSNVLNIITNGYVLPFLSKPSLVRFPLILSEYKACQKDQALATCIQSLLSKNAIKRVENVKSLGFYSRLAQYFSTCRKVQNGNSRVHQDLPDSRGMGIIDRPIRCLPSHPHHPNSRKYLRFCYRSQVFQFTSLPFGLATAPQVFTMIVKEVKLMALSRGLKLHQYLDDWLIRSQSQEKAQVNTEGVVDLTQSLGLDNKSGKIRTETYLGVFVRGLRIPSRFSPCKTHSREMAQTSGFDPKTQIKKCLDCKMFDVANWVARLNGENGPGRTPSHQALSVSPQGALDISSVAGQPPSLDRSHCSTLRLVAKSLKHDERCRPSSQRPQYPTLSDASNEDWGSHLDQSSTKGLWSDREKKLHINVLELKAVSLALRSFKDQCQNQTVLVATGN